MSYSASIEEITEAWNNEYKKQGIPSSFRKDPSKTVVEFINWIKKTGNCPGNYALDIGCGLGRNSFYLASCGFNVVAIDLLEENVNKINTEASLNNLAVKAFTQDACCSWPIAPDSLDIAIDIFCYKHIATKEKQKKYRHALYTSLKTAGFFFISCASEKDGFYGPLLEQSPNPKEKQILDPYSQISSFLYSQEDLIKEFSDYFELVDIKEQGSTSPMYSKEYRRSVLNAIFKKRA